MAELLKQSALIFLPLSNSSWFSEQNSTFLKLVDRIRSQIHIESVKF
jgi:hypothetical protein